MSAVAALVFPGLHTGHTVHPTPAVPLLPWAPQRQDQWWQLMTAPEGLGRIAWMVDNTLSAALLEKA